MSDQNFIFISHDSGFTDFKRKGANKAFIRTSSDQQCGSRSCGRPISWSPIAKYPIVDQGFNSVTIISIKLREIMGQR
ncbi:unnamed protein product [Pieris brassicae]|uniref:Uncharacterized protein n=1 Tax=Pieris brassicae TaxID=7116 RepID=A0A9P0TNK4_PIEBR|nr:unnamed protein product [Pieris brassicae]